MTNVISLKNRFTYIDNVTMLCYAEINKYNLTKEGRNVNIKKGFIS